MFVKSIINWCPTGMESSNIHLVHFMCYIMSVITRHLIDCDHWLSALIISQTVVYFPVKPLHSLVFCQSFSSAEQHPVELV